MMLQSYSSILSAPGIYGILLSMVFSAFACGGGGAGGGSAAVTISGTVHAGPVAGAAVVFRDINGAVACSATTAGDGSFAMEIPGSFVIKDGVLEASGGTCTDEATGTNTTAGQLAAFTQGLSLKEGSAINVTAGSTVVARLIEDHGKSRYGAENFFGTAFGYIPDVRIEPVNAVAGSDDERLAALRAGTFSQLNANLGLTPDQQFGLLEALGTDLSDGILNGKSGPDPVVLPGGGSIPEDIQNLFEHALLEYLNNPNNLTGLDADGIGFLPFAKVALTDSYRVEYIPVDPGASLGRTPFTLQVTQRSTGDLVPGLDVAPLPVMHMATQEHSTPVDDTTDNGDGTYDGAVYYLMAGGEGWGYWRLNIALDNGQGFESVDLFPAVGSPNLAYLRGQEDLVEGLGGGQKRVYYLIDDGLTVQNEAEGTYRFGLFVAAGEDEWSYPALATGLDLHDEDAAPWTVTSVTVQFSLDAVNWSPMTDEGGGHFTISGITGLDPASSELSLYVRLNVNGEQKTTDGAPESGSNGYAALVTGGASCCF